MKKKKNIILLVLVLGLGVLAGWWFKQQDLNQQINQLSEVVSETVTVPAMLQGSNPLQIEQMRQYQYPGSDITVVETLSSGSNYQRFRVSYESEGNTIYALMTVPTGKKPETGWPVIVFNHGYIPPQEYRTTERYVAYVDAFARQGYVVFKSDYRGHGESEGQPEGAYGSPAYTRDVLNGVASVKRWKDVDPNRIGMWGHSMGGYITVRSMVVTKDIKVGVIWGGVVAPYTDLLANWRRSASAARPPTATNSARSWRNTWQALYGSPEVNPDFWNSISANSYVADISGPLQLHHARGDESVPWEFSQTLANELTAVNQPVELFLYEGDNHNLSGNFSLAMQRSLAFFNKYLKS